MNSAPVPQPPVTPLTERMSAALSRLEACVMRTETVLRRLRVTQPEALSSDSVATLAPQLSAHETAARIEQQLELLEQNIETSINLL